MTTKKIRVRITDEVTTYTTGGKRYVPGDEVDIEPSAFCASFMVKVEKPKPVKKAVKPTETIQPTQPSAETVEVTVPISAGDFVCEVCGTSYGDMTSTEPQVCPKCGAKKVEAKLTRKSRRKRKP